MFDDPRLSEGRVKLVAGDRVVLYTDGVTEARSPAGEFYDEWRLAAFLTALDPDLSAEDVARAVKADVVAVTGSEDFEDDMTLVVMRVPALVAQPTTGVTADAIPVAAEPALVPGLPA